MIEENLNSQYTSGRGSSDREIERICFPPKRGLLRENDGGTCEQGAGIFSGGCGQGDRKDRRFFSTVSRQMNPLFGMSFLQTPGCMIHRGRQSCCWGLTSPGIPQAGSCVRTDAALSCHTERERKEKGSSHLSGRQSGNV